MRQFFSDVTNQMRGIWARLEGPQRLVVGAVMVATAVGLGAIVWFAGQPSYEVVFTARSGDEIGRVQQALQQAGVSYLPDDSGMGIMVERTKVGQAKAAIVREGLNGTQEVSLDGSGSLIEDAATKKWRLNNASRAQAERAIQELDGVVSVTVTGSRPDRLIAYRDRQAEQKAKATVVIRLAAGVPFESTARSAASIASSQLMIPLQNIDVVSTTGGQRWSYNPDRDAGGGSSEFLALQRDISDARTRIAQARLDQLWPNKTAVQVTVELDPEWTITSEKKYDEGVITKEELTKDTTDGAAQADGSAGSKSKNEQRTKEYATGVTESRTGKMMPDIARMSVALLYDKTLTDDADFDPAALEKTVKAIVGWDKSYDESHFSIMKGTFQPPAEPPAPYAGPGITEVALQYAPMAGQLLGVVIVVLFLRGLFKRSARSSASQDALAVAPEEPLGPEEQERRMRREIERSIASDPAALAKLLETWLMEQKV